MNAKLDFKVVVPAAQAGDKAAQDAIMENFYGWSILQARQIARDEERAADAAVDFWDRMLRQGGIRAYDGRVPFLTWLRVRLRSHTIDWLRKHRQPTVYSYGNSPVDDTVAYEPDPADELIADEWWKRLRERLSDREYDVLSATAAGCTAVKLAHAFGCSTQHVYDVLSAARAKVREMQDE